MNAISSPITDLLNNLLGGYWAGLAQHRTHVALLDSWSVSGLARSMEARIDDEPITIQSLLDRLLDLGGQPNFTIPVPNIGGSLREVLDNDIEVQRQAPAALNAAAEAAGAAHDATTRVLLEAILAAEETHLTWLQSEIDLLERLGEPLYIANRLAPSSAVPIG